MRVPTKIYENRTGAAEKGASIRQYTKTAREQPKIVRPYENIRKLHGSNRKTRAPTKIIENRMGAAEKGTSLRKSTKTAWEQPKKARPNENLRNNAREQPKKGAPLRKETKTAREQPKKARPHENQRKLLVLASVFELRLTLVLVREPVLV